jgi:hypothetical protein
MNTFEKLTAPLNAFLNEKGTQIDEESDSRTLLFSDFADISHPNFSNSVFN